ncbi:MAG TPA: outer membrane protein assembly factor BamA [Gammaproteobacteria bacterium]|nr:outer membrane protein assembly factor BamA [Gammaproteobacteria bacterium]
MIKTKILSVSFLAFFMWSIQALALEEFEVTDIQVNGIQRISAGTIFNYLPIKVGDFVDDNEINDAIKALFDTGFFQDIEISRKGGVLIIDIVERPTVASIEFSGNKEFKTEALKKGMLQVGFGEGLVFKKAILGKVTQELRSQYYSIGKYSVNIKTTVTPLERNRVKINIDIKEGKTARVGEVSIVGNHVFSDKKLLKLFKVKPKTGWRKLNFLSKSDQYSKQKLAGDLEALRSYYQDRGYLDFRIDSTQVSISENKKKIFITINITEGKVYTINKVSLRGKFVVPEKDLKVLVTIFHGDIFSRKEVEKTSKAISDRLAESGYTFANVNAIPDIDKENRTVSFVFNIEPSKRVYVRRINIYGNTTTRDEVIRRELRQLEGGWLSTKDVRRSKIRLQRLSFFEDVNIETPAVPGTEDQVDINVRVKERQTGSMMFGLGYSESDGVLLQASINQKNLFGSGRELAVSIDTSKITRSARIRYFNPYYTVNGVSRGFYLTYTDIDAARANLSRYINETISVGVNYRVPLSEDNSFSFSFGPDRSNLSATDGTPDEILAYIALHPSDWYLKTTASWVHDSRDSILYPTTGFYARLLGEASLPGSQLDYYKTGLSFSWHLPTISEVVLKFSGDMGYGDVYGDTQIFPFYKNYYAGGSSSVRGYKARSLGPLDSTGNPIGGSRRVVGGIDVLIPFPGSEKKDKRLSLFVDGGMVFSPSEQVDLADLRYSYGVGLYWYSPVGPLSLSYALPINNKPADRLEKFQFTIGRGFR